MNQNALDHLAINTIRFLAVDAVQHANSGHPGMPLDAAPMAYVLWTRFLKHNPADPRWIDRDRFVLSAGHASALLCALLHLTGYEEMTLPQLQRFRQWESLTPGHPESHLAGCIEASTGPLGQGIGNADGMAIAEAHLAARYNRPGHEIFDHHTYVLASDGDMMEGVQAEAASLAGHLRIGKLIVLYDSNRVTLSGTTSLAFTEDVGARYQSYGWHVQRVDDGNDLAAITRALQAAREIKDQPSLVVVQTVIGFGAPGKAGTFAVHGAPLGADEVRKTKANLGWPEQPAFFHPQETDPELILIGTGSELSLVASAERALRARGVRVRVVSMPSWELFSAESAGYRDSVLPASVTARFAVEAGRSIGWERWVGPGGDILSVDRFGASAPGEVVMKEYGFTVDHVVTRALALLGRPEALG